MSNQACSWLCCDTSSTAVKVLTFATPWSLLLDVSACSYQRDLQRQLSIINILGIWAGIGDPGQPANQAALSSAF
jgi:hypothetical protein